MFDYIAVSATMTDRAIEYVDHLHEHFEHPVVVRRGRYLAPAEPGYSIAIRPASRLAYAYPDGEIWSRRTAEAERARLAPEPVSREL